MRAEDVEGFLRRTRELIKARKGLLLLPVNPAKLGEERMEWLASELEES
jgi:hypothetical protein